MAEQLRFTVPPSYDGKTAFHFFKNHCCLSSRMITRLKREKDGILRNGKILRTVDILHSGEIIVLSLPEEESPYIEPVEGSLDILYEDAYLLAVNKPPFMPVHPVKQHQNDTLANIVTAYMHQKGERYVFRAHNRLDRDTSGIVLIAKDRFTINKLKGKVQKTYFAVVHGDLPQGGTLCAPIGLHDDSKMVRHVVEEGPPAVTHYEVLYHDSELSYLQLWLETGKTHQIRCHMRHLGHPLVGDDLYGGSREKISRQALHCGRVTFSHPVTGETVRLRTELPQDMQNLLKDKKICR